MFLQGRSQGIDLSSGKCLKSGSYLRTWGDARDSSASKLLSMMTREGIKEGQKASSQF